MNSFANHVKASGKTTISAFGDSITAGASVPEAARWTNRLATQMHLGLRNKGISGTVLQGSPDADGNPRAGNGMDRFKGNLLGKERSDLVAILYGFNDARHMGAPRSLNHAGFVRDYRAILRQLIAAGFAAADICIGSLPHIPDAGFLVGDPAFTGQSRDGFEGYVATARSLAHEFGTFYAPVNERMQASGGDALILPDHVHPNATGHGVIADAFVNATILN